MLNYLSCGHSLQLSECCAVESHENCPFGIFEARSEEYITKTNKSNKQLIVYSKCTDYTAFKGREASETKYVSMKFFMMTKFGQKCKTFLDILHLVTTFFCTFSHFP